MITARQDFYSKVSPAAFTRQNILSGHAIKINPALIVMVDTLTDQVTPAVLQQRVKSAVVFLLQHKIRTFHLDLNFNDYGGFKANMPPVNTAVFTPAFIEDLNGIVRANNGFLNLHLLTGDPLRHWERFDHILLGAVCFQLDAVFEPARLRELVARITATGACASPVIETVGSDTLIPAGPDAVFALLEPVLADIGLLTFQTAQTAARSDTSAGRFQPDRLEPYLRPARQSFGGAIQLQGGITLETAAQAVQLGADFLVCGTELFYNKAGFSTPQVIDRMFETIAATFEPA